MKKEKFLIIVLFLIFVNLLLSPKCLAQIHPPEKEEAENFAKNLATSTKSFFGFFGKFWSQKIIPFFLNLGEKIKSLWQEKAKFEIINLWKRFVLFFEKEVVIE